jgi:hypothetical protein
MFPRPHFFDCTDNNVTVEPSFPSLNVLLILPSHPPLDRYPRSPRRTLGRECPLPRSRGDFCRVKHCHLHEPESCGFVGTEGPVGTADGAEAAATQADPAARQAAAAAAPAPVGGRGCAFRRKVAKPPDFRSVGSSSRGPKRGRQAFRRTSLRRTAWLAWSDSNWGIYWDQNPRVSPGNFCRLGRNGAAETVRVGAAGVADVQLGQGFSSCGETAGVSGTELP